MYRILRSVTAVQMTEASDNLANRTDALGPSGSAPQNAHLFCSYCGTEDKSDYGYCDHCGERVAAPDIVRYRRNDLGKCAVCSTEVLTRAKNCLGCGVAFDSSPVIPYEKATDPAIVDAAHPNPVNAAQAAYRPVDQDAGSGGRPGRVPYVRKPNPKTEFRDSEASPAADSDVRRAPATSEQPDAETNDSGTPEGRLPEELHGFNWGAVLLGPVWGIGNRSWITMVLLIVVFLPIHPTMMLILYLVGTAYLGTQANRLAWRSRKWVGINHFRRTQQNWAFWGFVSSPALFMLASP